MARAAEMHAESEAAGKGNGFAQIAHEIGLSQAAVSGRFYLHGPTFTPGGPTAPRAGIIHRRSNAEIEAEDGRPAAGSVRIAPTLVVERDARAAAADRRTYTQEFFGDPPPGFSALEGKQGMR